MWRIIDRCTQINPLYVRRSAFLLLVVWIVIMLPLTLTVWAQSVLWVNIQSAVAIVLSLLAWLSAERPTEMIDE